MVSALPCAMCLHLRCIFSNLYNNAWREVNRKKCELKEVKLLAEITQLVREPQN